jgi:poly(3-hydroxybutyrate) depolymerase
MTTKRMILGAFLVGTALGWHGVGIGAEVLSELPQLNLAPKDVTVSGISSGAFMAVQFGVAHSSTVRGIAATAGGPYFCAGKDSWGGAGVDKVMQRCMQGDPAYPAVDITAADLKASADAASRWAKAGAIDPLSNLKSSSVWIFHGYNDGIVKKPVSDALENWMLMFVPPEQVFYKENLPAAHAQISASCSQTKAKTCNRCDQTGGNYINMCAPDGAVYDAAGAALQMFYGPMQRVTSSALSSTLVEFSQAGYARHEGKPVEAYKIAIANTGFLYVPASCKAGAACKLHIAFHGCGQNADSIGTDFAKGAGYNEWADANQLVVLYPQTKAVVSAPITPFNPQGCWDWWGYNDFGYDDVGHYATRQGDQIDTVWQMVQRLLSSNAVSSAAENVTVSAPAAIKVVDLSHRQVSLAWRSVPGATGYHVYRGDPAVRVTLKPLSLPVYVDRDVSPAKRFSYRVSALSGSGEESPQTPPVSAQTAKAPPTNCDPYFSIAGNRTVDKKNLPTSKTCP